MVTHIVPIMDDTHVNNIAHVSLASQVGQFFNF